MGPLAARLKSCSDAYRSLKVILQVALLIEKFVLHSRPEWIPAELMGSAVRTLIS
jgi:hypothetical protein